MEQYYDSDEGIAWGPPTIQEIKSNLLKGKRTIRKRMTTFGRLQSESLKFSNNKESNNKSKKETTVNFEEKNLASLKQIENFTIYEEEFKPTSFETERKFEKTQQERIKSISDNFNNSTECKIDQTQIITFKTPKLPHAKAKTNKYKNIISPVSLYVKNSPAVYKKENYSKAVKTKALNVNHKVRRKVFYPEVIYRPAKKQIEVGENKIKIPASIEKLIPSTVCVKHQRQTRRMPLSDVQKRLEDGNLTRYNLEESAHDVSVHITGSALNY